MLALFNKLVKRGTKAKEVEKKTTKPTKTTTTTNWTKEIKPQTSQKLTRFECMYRTLFFCLSLVYLGPVN